MYTELHQEGREAPDRSNAPLKTTGNGSSDESDREGSPLGPLGSARQGADAGTQSSLTAQLSQRWQLHYITGLLLADLLAWIAASMLAGFISLGSLRAILTVASIRLPYWAAVAILTIVWLVSFALSGVYDREKAGFGSDEYRGLLNGAVRFLAILALLALAGRADLARSFVLTAWPLATLGALFIHYMARHWLRQQRRSRHCLKRTLLIGRPQHVADFESHLNRDPNAGLAVTAICTPCGEGDAARIESAEANCVTTFETAGRGLTTADVLQAIEVTESQIVAILDNELLCEDELRPLAYELESREVELIVIPTVMCVAGPRISIYPVGGIPFLHISKPNLSGIQSYLKGAIDRSISSLLLIVLSPLMLVVALAIRATSGRPVLFKQSRVGHRGRLFTLYKFRTMEVGAERARDALATKNEADGPLFKMSQDPRVTRVGAWLRHRSIDELPQLWNVLVGQMALVGPRPPLVSEVEAFGEDAQRRFLVKPGLTGLWQVSGRATLPWREAVRLDLYYVENWSLGLDITILAKTITAVVGASGAH